MRSRIKGFVSEYKSIDQEARSREANLIITGVCETNGENCEYCYRSDTKKFEPGIILICYYTGTEAEWYQVLRGSRCSNVSKRVAETVTANNESLKKVFREHSNYTNYSNIPTRNTQCAMDTVSSNATDEPRTESLPPGTTRASESNVNHRYADIVPEHQSQRAPSRDKCLSTEVSTVEATPNGSPKSPRGKGPLPANCAKSFPFKSNTDPTNTDRSDNPTEGEPRLPPRDNSSVECELNPVQDKSYSAVVFDPGNTDTTVGVSGSNG